jgi:hypothetical protein
MIQKRTPPQVRRIIAQKLAMRRRWEQNPEGMLKRAKAGAAAMSRLADQHRVWWGNWLHERASRLTKGQLLEGIAKTIREEGRQGHVQPKSVLARLMRYGFLRYDEQAGEYLNLRSQESL